MSDLDRYIDVVYYEIWMFRRTYAHLNSPNPERSKYNALIESFIIHAYNLYRFFYQGEREKVKGVTKRRRPSDLIAEDFNINRSYFRRNRTHKRLLKGIQKRRDKELAHLTKDRIYKRPETKIWNFGEIYRMVNNTVEVFLLALPEEDRKKFLSKLNQ